MNKVFLAVILILAIVSCCLGVIVYFNYQDTFLVKFIVDGNDYATVVSKGNETLQLPPNPTKEGFDFQGWYWDEGDWEKPFTQDSLLDTSLSSDVSIFSYFKKQIANYEVLEWMWTGFDSATVKLSNNETLIGLESTITSETTTPATCTTDGIKTYTASVIFDGKTYTDTNTETIPALTHDLISHNAQTVTCTEKGWDAYNTCSRCDYTTYIEIPALTHDLISHNAQTVTCTEKGWDAYDTCSRCDYTTYIEIPALGHSTAVYQAVAPTCTQTGLTEGSYCSRCDAVLVAQLIVSAVGHSWVDATCVAPETCSACSLTRGEAKGHNFVEFDCTQCDVRREYYYGDGNSIYFGTYPQRREGGVDTLAALNSLAGTLPTSEAFNGWTNYEYYIGKNEQNSSSNEVAYMWYKDITLENGQKYRGVYFDKLRPFYTTNASVAYETWQLENGYEPLVVYWFVFEPIKWNCLSENDTGEKLLLAQFILDGQAFNDVRYYDSTDEMFYNKNEGTPDGIFANNWQWSTIRAWLNDSFYNLAFTEGQQNLIKIQTLDNITTAGTYNSFAACQQNTDDKVFLLSLKDISNREYGFRNRVEDWAKIKYATAYALVQGVGCMETSVSDDRTAANWWMRSADSEYSKNVLLANGEGKILSIYGVDFAAGGVVPALCFQLPTFEDWVTILPATCTEPGQQYRVSTDGVYYEINILPALEHTGDGATCTDKAVCTVCGCEYGELTDHTWTPATCLLPKTCSVCFATEGEVLEHIWAPANCTTPKTCTLCSTTEGVALGHSGGTATCNTLAVCDVCGHEYGNYVHMESGECTLCTPDATTGLIYLEIDEGRAYSVEKGLSTIGELIIPAYYNGKPITTIKSHGFESLAITSVFIPHTVTVIGEGAFSTCESLSAISFGINSLLSEIGEYAFSQSHLSSILLSATVTTIGYRAFYQCDSINIYCEAESKPLGWNDQWLDNPTANTYWANQWCFDGDGVCGAHTGGTATCTKLAICTRCEKPYGQLFQHIYSETWTFDETNHWRICTNSECTSIADNSAHSGGSATCEHKAICSVCAQQYGDLAQHTNAVDEAVASTCTSTGLTEGSHCSICDEVIVAQQLTPALPHTWAEGVCLACSTVVYTHSTEDGKEYIFFGFYPQTIKAADVTLSATADDNGHYTGSDGAKYVKVVATPEKTLEFSTDAQIYEGTEYYFKVEPIKWRILSLVNGQALLLCESAIANVRFSDEINNYEESEIRKWLNGQFIQDAFTPLQKLLILTTTVDNSAATTNTATNADICPNTNDEVFLLSYADMLNSDYRFTDNESRIKTTTDYCRATGGWTSDGSSYDYGNTCWWLRSPLDSGTTRALYIYPDGSISNIKCNRSSYTAVPALIIDFCRNGHSVDNNCLCSECGQYSHTINSDSCYCTVCRLPFHDFVNDICAKCGEEQLFVRTSDAFYFGNYPQTKVTDSALIASLNNLAGTLPNSNDDYKWTSYGYFIDGYVTNYMWFIDKEHGGNRYRGVYFTSYRSKCTEWEDGNYQEGNGYYVSNIYWFKFEPIKWIILSEDSFKNQAFLVADLILDSQEFNYTVNNHPENGDFSSNWESSTIRKWLRDCFMQTAFTQSQKGIIVEQTLDNKTTAINGSGNNFATCQNNTTDKIFLLSFQDLSNTSYGIDETARLKKVSDYAQSQGCFNSTEESFVGNGQWWLRSASTIYSYVSIVKHKGDLSMYNVSNTYFGVVPALVIQLP